ncbi:MULTISPECIES: TrbM/KikA/MpfK family conjugal transfer protein [unclassified Pseudomonas]|uniref:TrbM/KikA/MpfK family conjugal transfer protein n=2 Tax=Pseudomonas TaxID=286 RepID=UPI0020B81AC0|nr:MULTISPECIES: TrbM/KikA/MpfK family conjugal transfer protein [unclassified Pseudomonas]MCP3791923.1 TrbM/KikA/MpfK family conjugal transfer protein [Pseudomonas sp. N2-11]MDI3373218.1 TrbM/KikA/MpfK family conjugal transfer protein [Pseudomonas sp. V104_6]
MKATKLFPAVALALSASVSAPTFAGDPCATVLCMFGKLKGAGVVEGCEGPVADYFNIVKRKKHGGIKWNDTANARQSFLDSCPAADSDKTKEINNKFGKVI